jgi:RHH-type transcriptional regulator, proline utilization regulon repressor / proline dehydrogenase / delta 1-pyrroline-5-carboxylate dehydrogenase
MASTEAVPAWASAREAIEARTQAVGRQLLADAEDYRPGPAERIEDWLLTYAVADERFRARLLRFIDVLGSLDFPGSDAEVVRLLREYFDDDFPEVPRGLRWLLRAGRDERVPVAVAARTARRSAEVFARRFIVSPGVDTVREVIDALGGQGRLPSFDLLGEAVLSRAEADEYIERYLALIEQLAALPQARERTPGGVAALQVSIKLSSLTHRFVPLDWEGSIERARPALERVCVAAREAGVGVTVDMEQYELRDLTWELFRRTLGPGTALADWPDAGIVVQAYLRDGHLDAAEAARFGRERGTPLQVRLVKGAYWDYEGIVADANRWPSPVFAEKGDTDAQFERALELLVHAHREGAITLAVASHNPRAHARATALAEAAGLPAGALEHQTLHRTAEGISRALTEAGWTARDYVPVGELLPGMAYLVRRVLENSSQAGFLVQSRTGASPEEVLRPPPPHAPAPAEVSPLPGAFQRAPVARWFDATFRADFEAALHDTRNGWGRRVPLALGEGAPPGDWIEMRSPSSPSGDPIGTVEFATASHVERSVAVASGAHEGWSARPVTERAAILRRAATLLEERGHEFAVRVVHEGGRDRGDAWGEVEEAADFLNLYAGEAELLFAEFAERIAPRGVVAVIPPWNFSLAIPMGLVAAALVCGNTVILKPAEQTPLIARHLVELLHEAGVPPGALVYLPGEGETVGAALVEHPDVAMIAFTGSRAVGTWMHEAVARVARADGQPKTLLAEMGGKNPVIVFADADPDEAVAGVLRSAFGHANQKCSAASRVLIQRPIDQRLRDRLVQAASSMVAGPADDAATEINPIINREALDRLRGAANVARSEGRVLYDAFDQAEGTLLAGPLIVEIPPERALEAQTATEELFGPILALIPFDEQDEAYRIANGTLYGLTSGVFSRSPATIARAARAIDAGHVYANRAITAARPGVEPFGGHRRSGTGPKAGSTEHLWAYVRRTDAGAVDAPMDVAASAARIELEPARWDAPVEERIAAVKRAAGILEREGDANASMLREAAEQARAELERPARTVPVAGQRTEMRYDVPRGLGLVRARGEHAPWWLAGPLLAGNAVAVIDSPPPLDRVLVALWAAGVPAEALRSLEGGVAELLKAAESPAVAFAATDGGPLTALRQRLARTAEGQPWLKALLAPLDGPQPGEPGFLHRFAWPRVVAVRTLRHGADLSLAMDEG